MRRWRVAAFVVAIAGVVAGSSSVGARGLRDGGMFRIATDGQQFTTADPALLSAPLPSVIMRATCGRLMRNADLPLPAGFRIVPDLAVGFPLITSGGRKYTFTIRNGLRFSTGAPVTADDFAFTLNRILNPAFKALDAAALAEIVGARDVIDGKALRASGIVVQGNKLTISLVQPDGGFIARMAGLDSCVLPSTLPLDPEGVKAPVPSAGPYFISQFVPGQELVLERNRFYSGDRPHHVDGFVVDLTADLSQVAGAVERGQYDYALLGTPEFGAQTDQLKKRYGVNKSRFFVYPAAFLRSFVINTAGPLFKDNVPLRQAVNFAVDRKALQRPLGTIAGTLTDQYLPPGLPAYRNATIYPLRAADLVRARALAKGHTRSGKAVLYLPSLPTAITQGQVLKADLAKIGLDVAIQVFPPPILFQKLATRGEPFDLAWAGFLTGPDLATPDPSSLNALFDGRTIGKPGSFNFSGFNSPRYNLLLERAARLPIGPKRDLTYGALDVDLARNAAPLIAYSDDNALTLVSARTGCVIANPYLDLAAVCLK
jgi:peptide/nickel transport system substrate-binding protein